MGNSGSSLLVSNTINTSYQQRTALSCLEWTCIRKKPCLLSRITKKRYFPQNSPQFLLGIRGSNKTLHNYIKKMGTNKTRNRAHCRFGENWSVKRWWQNHFFLEYNQYKPMYLLSSLFGCLTKWSLILYTILSTVTRRESVFGRANFFSNIVKNPVFSVSYVQKWPNFITLSHVLFKICFLSLFSHI